MRKRKQISIPSVLRGCPAGRVAGALFAVALMLALGSCEKVIDINLAGADKKYVIEAVVTDLPGTARVTITQTKDFNADNQYDGIGGATVTVREIGGPTTGFSEISAGVYEATSLVAQNGKTYELSVTFNGQSYSAICTMPQKVNLDTLYVSDELLFTDFRKIMNVEYRDPPGRGNSYRFIQYVNGLKEDQLMIENDDYTDGRNIDSKLYFFADDDEEEYKIDSGDTVRVDMLCIDPAIYKYWFSLDRSAGGTSGQATPSNPVTNMKGGALGYFSTHTVQSKTVIVP